MWTRGGRPPARLRHRLAFSAVLVIAWAVVPYVVAKALIGGPHALTDLVLIGAACAGAAYSWWRVVGP